MQRTEQVSEFKERLVAVIKYIKRDLCVLLR